MYVNVFPYRIQNSTGIHVIDFHVVATGSTVTRRTHPDTHIYLAGTIISEWY